MTMSHEQVWKAASKVLQGMLSPDLYSRWFVPIKSLALTYDTLTLGVANEFYQIWLQDNFLPLVREAVTQSAKRPMQVKFAVANGIKGDGKIGELPRPEKMPRTRAALDLNLNPRYTFESFVVGPNNNFAHAAALAVSQSPAKAYNPYPYGYGHEIQRQKPVLNERRRPLIGRLPPARYSLRGEPPITNAR